ncbi:MAG: IPT/TIG domain-containing protein, partial [Candidatus Marinimicrobia bacterium]|nr:IPT/TIG domain-containing protein [Candidatus Neomarinimicrobiota bacterium]
MKQKRTLLLIAISLFAFTLLMCEYTDYPDPIWDEDDAGNAAPVITSMSPPDLAYEGITEITITGSNFSSVPSQNQVTFNGYAARLDEANSTSTQLVLTTPVFITESRGSEFNAVDSVQILVAAQGAYSPAEYDQPFRVERAVVKLGGFAGEAPAKNATTVTADANGNIYVAAEDKILYKIDSVGVRTAYATGLSGAERDLKAADPG